MSYFKHIDGGIYHFLSYATSADTQREVVIYEHIWPFEHGTWVRDQDEFEKKFSYISLTEVDRIVRMDRIQGQLDVMAAKTARRAKVNTTHESNISS